MSKEKNNVVEVYEDKYKNNCSATVKYYINPDKKVVVCKIYPYVTCSCGSQFLFGCDCSNSYKESISKSFFEMCNETETSFTGKAICMEEDEFSIETGKKISYDKAMIKLLYAKKKFFNTDMQEMLSYADDDQELIDNIDAQIEKAQARFEKKMKELG